MLKRGYEDLYSIQSEICDPISPLFEAAKIRHLYKVITPWPKTSLQESSNQ